MEEKKQDRVQDVVANGALAEKAAGVGDELKMMYDEPAVMSGTFATSFDELDAEREARDQVDGLRGTIHDFSEIVSNIMVSDMDDKPGALVGAAREFASRIGGALTGKQKQRPMKTEGGVKFPASDFAFVPDPEKPSTWELRLAEGRPGNITASQLGRAAAALSPGGFRGQPADLPSGAVAGIKRRIRSGYEKLGVKRGDMPDSVKEVNGFTVWKEAGGAYRWLAIYSNRYRDRDTPPEIISEAAHERFVKETDEGLWSYPVLQLWHVPGTDLGSGDFVAYADGFALASGTIDEGHEMEAEALSAMKGLLVSHCMPSRFIERDTKDKSIITRYVTTEVSVLPAWAAANQLTSFYLDRGGNMGLPREKKEFLAQAGLSQERIDDIEAGLDAKSKEAAELGLEFKEDNTEEPGDETAVQDGQFVTQREAAEATGAIGAAIKSLAQTIEAMSARVDELTKQVDGIARDDAEKVAEKAILTPAMSMRDHFVQSVIGNNAAAVGDESELANAMPNETKAATPNRTGIPFLDEMLAGSM